jgi:hypothetical protein
MARSGIAIVSLLGGLAMGALVWAGTPFGGDDTGFIPPDQATLKCETTVGKNLGKLDLAISICHFKAADAGVKLKTFDEEACEQAALTKYTGANAKLTGCPNCLDPAALGTSAESQLDTLAAAAVYCDNTSGKALADADDDGFVPANATTEKCQNAVMKQLPKLVGTVTKCHAKAAADAMKTPPVAFDEEGCESAAVSKFDAFTAKLTTCPTCLSALFPLGQAIADGADAANGGTFCASPSGAFLD